MKKFLFLALITGATLSSCSKKSNPTAQSTGTVTINGTTYATVSIGTQSWTSVNYNGTGGVNYNSSSTNNPTYGKLYLISEATAISLPSGWRLPTLADASKLLVYMGATGNDGTGVEGDATVAIKLKSNSAWTLTQGNNSSGFNAYPAGDAYNNGTSEFIGEFAEFWTSSVDSGNDQYILGISDDAEPDTNPPLIDNYAYIDYIPAITLSASRLSIRFVKDN